MCRTRALGSKEIYQCDDCNEVTEIHHSCGDRHCPQCSGCKRYDFAERAEKLIIDGVTYYQVVFTLPGQLSELALANREVMADLLFESAAKSLLKRVRREQGYQPAAMMVLHTWNQKLEPHWHVHALVPGGGPSVDGKQWKSAQAPPDAPNSDDHYLCDAINLRESFRDKAIARLRKLRLQGQLKFGGKFAYLQDDAAWETFCKELEAIDWVSFIQPPPTKSCTAEQVVRYLTRYLTGGPISEGRILAADSEEVTFLAREGKRVGGEREQVPVTLPTLEFVRRWCEHIQPEQLTKTRYFGGWCNQQRKGYQANSLELHSQHVQANGGSKPKPKLERSAEREPQAPVRQCGFCESHAVRVIGGVRKPSWSDILSSRNERCPEWYREVLHEEHCAYLEREYGISYEDWALEMGIESTMKSAPPVELRQLYFPGLSPERDYQLESY
jgi:hypothetical protein